MLITGKLLAAAMAGACTTPPASVYIDEASYFVTPTTAALFNEARKYGLRLHCFCQHVTSQFRGHLKVHDVADSILANSGSFLLFRAGLREAERLEPLVRPDFSTRDLQRLQNFEAIGRILVDGRPSEPVLVRTPPPTTTKPQNSSIS